MRDVLGSYGICGGKLQRFHQLEFEMGETRIVCEVCGEVRTKENGVKRYDGTGWLVCWREIGGKYICPACYMHRFGEFSRILGRLSEGDQ